MQDMTGYSPNDPAAYLFADIPGMYHNRAAGFSFADGHAEIKKWRDGHVLGCNAPPPLGVQQDAATGDLAWLQERSSSPP